MRGERPPVAEGHAVPSQLGMVVAATVVIHGDALSRVDAPGPSLPAEADTKMPEAAAPRNASSIDGVRGPRLRRRRSSS